MEHTFMILSFVAALASQCIILTLPFTMNKNKFKQSTCCIHLLSVWNFCLPRERKLLSLYLFLPFFEWENQCMLPMLWNCYWNGKRSMLYMQKRILMIFFFFLTKVYNYQVSTSSETLNEETSFKMS